MMQKDEKLELLSAYLDDELTETQRAEVEAMLAADSEMFRACTELQEIRHGLRSAPTLQPPPALLDGVMRRIGQEAPPWRTTDLVAPGRSAMSPASLAGARAGRWVALVAVCAAGVLAAITYYRANDSGGSSVVENPRPVAPANDLDRDLAATDANDDSSGSDSNLDDLHTHPIDSPTADAPFLTGDLPPGMQIMSMFDVLITEAAYQEKRFHRVLGEAEIKVEDGLRVDQDLEEALFGTRLLGRLEPPAGNAPAEAPPRPLADAPERPELKKVELVYVVATGPQIDMVYRRLTELPPKDIRGVRMDLALTRGDQRLFQELNRAAGGLLVVGPTRPQVSGIARSVAMSVAAESRLLRQVRNLALPTIGVVGAGMLNPGIAAPKPPGQAAGGAETFQAMFVLRVVPNN